MTRAALEAGLSSLPRPPSDRGTVELLVARGGAGERQLPHVALLTREGGLPGDRWVGDPRYGPKW